MNSFYICVWFFSITVFFFSTKSSSCDHIQMANMPLPSSVIIFIMIELQSSWQKNRWVKITEKRRCYAEKLTVLLRKSFAFLGLQQQYSNHNIRWIALCQSKPLNTIQQFSPKKCGVCKNRIEQKRAKWRSTHQTCLFLLFFLAFFII